MSMFYLWLTVTPHSMFLALLGVGATISEALLSLITYHIWIKKQSRCAHIRIICLTKLCMHMYAKFYPVIAHETLLHSRRDIGHVAVGQVTLHYRGKAREPIFKKDMIGRCGPVRIVYFFILKHNSGPTETVSGPDFCRASSLWVHLPSGYWLLYIF